jgi:hypothetical protein
MRKLYLILTPLLLIATLTCYFFSWLKVFPPEFWGIASNLWILMTVFAYGIMFLKGTLKKKKLSILIYLSFLLLFMGGAFRIQHWPGGNTSMLGGAAGVIIVYLIHFVQKREKFLIDWMKWCYITALMISFMLKTIYHPLQIYVAWVATILCLVPIGLFYFDEWKGIDRNLVSKAAISNTGEEIFIYNDGNDPMNV